jgi:hypothetical protein
MATSAPKTKATEASVSEFIDSVADETRKQDAKVVDQYMQELTAEKPKMWGSAIIGYGSAPIKYKDGRELNWPIAAFSPRKQNLVLYVLNGGEEKYADLLAKLGKYKTGKVCLYINHLSDVDHGVLKDIIKRSLTF